MNDGGIIDATGKFVYSCATCRAHLDVSPSMLTDSDVKRKLYYYFLHGVKNYKVDNARNMLGHYPWLATEKTSNNSPMCEAACNMHIPMMELLSQHGATMFDKLEDGCMPIHLYHNHDDSDDEEEEEIEEETEMIFTAIANGDDDVVRQLIRNDPNIVNHHSEVSDMPVSHYIALYGSKELEMEIMENPNTDVNLLCGNMPLHAYALLSYEAFAILINRDDFEHLNHFDCQTHLHLCLACHNAHENRLKAIAMINHSDIDLSIQNRNGKTALDIARVKGLDDMVELIESKISISA